MSKNRKPRARPVHSSIKIALGYDPNLADQEVLQDWNERKRRVCKPCWELKYCPYGPLVEQSPVIPPLRSGLIEQNAYFRKCLETDMVGDVRTLTEEIRAEYQEWLEDDHLLLRQALHEVRSQRALEDAIGIRPAGNPGGRFSRRFLAGASFCGGAYKTKVSRCACHRGG